MDKTFQNLSALKMNLKRVGTSFYFYWHLSSILLLSCGLTRTALVPPLL